MNFCDINPFIRLAERLCYTSVLNHVKVRDCRIFYVPSGKAEITNDNQHYELVPGSLFYCCSDSFYSFASEGMEYLCLNFDLTQADNTHTALYPLTYINKNHNQTTKQEKNAGNNFVFSHLFIENASEYSTTLKKILEEFSMQKIYYRENCSSILKMLLIKLYRDSLSTTENSSDAISKVLTYIQTNYSQPINNQLLSKMTCYNANHLNRLFLNHTGTTIHQYILSMRINEAKKLLLNTNLPLNSIAEKVGFNNHTYFSSYFKRTENMTPRMFRKQFKNSI